jgi:hypothetical protein
MHNRRLWIEHAMQGDGLTKIEPIPQFLTDILWRLDSTQHAVFGQKTHQTGTVEMGTRQGACHGRVYGVQKPSLNARGVTHAKAGAVNLAKLRFYPPQGWTPDRVGGDETG